MQVINPDKIKPDAITKIYPVEVSRNVPKYLLITLISIGVLGILGTLLIFPYKSEELHPIPKRRVSLKEVHETDVEFDAIEESLFFTTENFNFCVGNHSDEVNAIIEAENEKDNKKIDQDLKMKRNSSYMKKNKSRNSLKNLLGNNISIANAHQQIYDLALIHPKIKESVVANDLIKFFI